MNAIKVLQFVAFTLCGASTTIAQTWTQTSAPSDVWSSIASSADGTKLVAATFSNVYTSTNSGTSWLLANTPHNFIWASVASSADGTKLAVAGNANTGSPILISSNSGSSWTTSSAPFLAWSSIASSSDGTKLAATYGGIYTSTNSGGTWMQQPVGGGLSSVASSADGNKLVVCVSSGSLIYNSTNAGATWISNSLPNGYWNSVSSSADGKVLVAVGVYNPIYISTNSGNTWQRSLRVNPTGLEPQWHSVACSADGKMMTAVCSYYSSFPSFSARTSTNSGATWTVSCTLNKFWNTVAASADGCEMFAADGVGLYTSKTTPVSKLNLAPTSGGLALSWIIPSTSFLLQQSSDLTTTNWSNVTNGPVLNLTNLQNQVNLPLPTGNAFFRLNTP
jgi:hypothetical protein